MDLSDENYNAGKATGRMSNRELVSAINSHDELRDLTENIDEAASLVASSDQVQIEDLIGILRHEAQRLETMYIRGLEQHIEELSEVSEEQMFEAMMEMKENNE